MLGRPTDSDSQHLDKYLIANNLNIIGDEDSETA